MRAGGVSVLVDEVQGEPGTFNGACGYAPAAIENGIIYSQRALDQTPEFRLFASGKHLD